MAHNFPKGLPVFHMRIYKLVEDPESDPIISWGKDNNSFVIWNLEEFDRRNIVDKFDCNRFSQFRADLRHYGFRRIKKGSGELEYGNEDFVRGHPERMKTMMIKAFRKHRAKFEAKEAAKEMQRLQI
ncbi:PREDICTED: heat stress transcription factor A-4a-like [Camelina sativa]|uniref:Heat stress transcription factor A-4a-like n=1 Tax=Camelina sativa TaxID=90675 RepID=A0ABM0V198_CAMSA|nr:PREDICTED: heat stress transcription factor A-4a-like [Camelina sativa]